MIIISELECVVAIKFLFVLHIYFSSHKIETATEKIVPNEPENGLDDVNAEKKKKKKRNGFSLNNGGDIQTNDVNDFEEELGAGHFEPMNEGYMGRPMMNEGVHQCPMLEAMEKRCRGVDLLSGDIHQELLPICGIHQLCYLCVSFAIIINRI